jgi:putative spermidine/putrescine transport system ATP-binding protein
MRVELKRLQNELGITFVHVTHTQPEAIALADQVVVMDHGVVEQAAGPRDIYNRPHSPYVARFMGGQNVLSGVADSAGPDGMSVRTADGMLYDLAPEAGVKPGDRVNFSIRRDHIKLVDDAGQRNGARGKVVNVEYQGTFVKVALDTGSREEFIVYLGEDEFYAAPRQVGDVASAAWDPRLNHFLAGTNNSTGNPHED